MYAHLLAKWHYFLPVCWPWPALSLSQLLVPTLAADSSAKQNQSQTRRHRNLKIKCCLCSNFLSLSEESMNLFGMYMNIHDCHLRHMPSSRKTNLGIEIELKNFEIFAKSFGAKAHDDILLQGRLLRSPHEEHLVFSWLSWVTTFSSDFLYLSIFFYIFLGCFMMSLHFSVFHGSQNQRSWLRCCDTHLRPLPRRPRRAQKNIEKGRNRTRCDSTTPTFSIRWLGCAASFGSLCEAQHLASQNPKKSLNTIRVKCIEMHWNATKFVKIRNKKKVLLFFSCQATGTPTTWVVFPWRGSILTTRLSDAAWDFFDWKSLHLCLSINMIFIIFLIDSSCISFLWCSLRCLRCLLVGLWPCCASTLDSTERSHGPWPVGVRTGSTSLGPMAQKFKLNPKTCMKFREIFIHQHHRITSIRMAANLCSNATKMYQIWSEQWIQYIHFHITRTEIPPRHSRPSNRQRKGAGTSASRARRSWPHDTSRGECSSWVFWMFLVWKTWIFWFSFRV